MESDTQEVSKRTRLVNRRVYTEVLKIDLTKVNLGLQTFPVSYLSIVYSGCPRYERHRKEFSLLSRMSQEGRGSLYWTSALLYKESRFGFPQFNRSDALFLGDFTNSERQNWGLTAGLIHNGFVNAILKSPESREDSLQGHSLFLYLLRAEEKRVSEFMQKLRAA